jgi:inosine-uridine nucleoside N-ribohydrolase
VAPPAVVIDCDPGHDDFLAILLAQRFADLRGITTVAGNTSVANATRNACIAADMCGFRGPVVAGASGPLLGEPQFAEHVHGASGLDGPELPTVIRPANDGEASSFLIDMCGPGTWLIATGPLTNVALAIRRDPGFATRLAGISLMGGSTSYGNITSAAEFNIWVTHTVLVDWPFVQRVRQLDTPPARFVGELLAAFVTAYSKMSRQPGFAPIHDPCALLWVTHPDLFGSVSARVDIELAGTFTRGMTVVDLRDLAVISAGNADVAISAASERALDLIYETVVAL